MPTTYLITGASRGIGHALVAASLQRPDTVVVASVRKRTESTVRTLEALPKAPDSKLFIVEIDSGTDNGAKDAIQTVSKDQGIDHLDVVIANAGMGTLEALRPMLEVPADSIREHFSVNTVGPVLLFQASFPLLKKANNAKFIAITSALGSNTLLQSIMAGLPLGTYSMTKAGLNAFVSQVKTEQPDITFIAMHPGEVDTDMVRATGAILAGIPTISPEASASGVLQQIDKITLEDSGKYLTLHGDTLPW